MSQVGARLLVVSGPSGVGKGTVVSRLRERRPDLTVSVSATTRPPRPHERDGEHYHFLSEEEFSARAEAGEFLEWANFGGHRYGTLWSSVADADGIVLLEIDVQGALQVRERVPGARLVFLRPPDEETLVARLEGRGTDSAARIAERVRIAHWELAQAEAFDDVVVNDDLAAAVDDVASILDAIAPHLRTEE